MVKKILCLLVMCLIFSVGAVGMASAKSNKAKSEEPVVEQTAKKSKLVNLNTASSEELQALPGIGEVTANAIIAQRSRRPFSSVDELGHIKGIGEKKLEKLRPLVDVK